MLSVQRPTFNQTTLSSLRSIRYALREQPIDSISSARRASSILLRRANRVIVKFEGAARLRWVRRHGRLESHFSLHRGDFAVAGFGARLASWRSLSRLAHRRSHRSREHGCILGCFPAAGWIHRRRCLVRTLIYSGGRAAKGNRARRTTSLPISEKTRGYAPNSPSQLRAARAAYFFSRLGIASEW